MKLFLLILTLLVVFLQGAAGQADSAVAPICGFGFTVRQQRTPQFMQALRRSEAVFRRELDRQRGTRTQETIYTIPVVVHVIHTGEAIGTGNNPSDASIQAMMDVLNAGFRKNGPQFGGVDVGIQFQLAIRSPQCGSTPGIDRVNGSSVPDYTTGGIAVVTYPGSADELAIKSLSRWPNTDYVNIWIVNKINGNSNAGGFAWYPEYNSARDDGIVICAGAVNGTNKTIVHEMGHVFNLRHTFEGSSETTCPSLTACATTGDQVCDTEPVLNIPCSTTINTCTGAPFQIADASQNYTVKNNYMGYTDCQWMFTQGQKDRMRAALLAFRGGLLTSGGLTAPAASPPLACTVSAANPPSPFFGVGRLKFSTLDVYSNSSDADGAFYIDRTCNQRTTVTSGKSYTLTIRPTYGNYQYVQAYIDYNADGDFTDANETLVTGADTSITVSVNIPTVGVRLNTPLRLRIVADNPSGIAPTACSLAGTPVDYQGVGQIEDYTVTVLPRTILSIVSGNWTTPTTWSCTCVPTSADMVSIQAGHTVSISSGLKQAFALNLLGKLEYGAGSQLQLTSN